MKYFLIASEMIHAKAFKAVVICERIALGVLALRPSDYKGARFYFFARRVDWPWKAVAEHFVNSLWLSYVYYSRRLHEERSVA